MTFWLRRVISVVALVFCAMGVAEAQPPTRPFRGLFGGAQPLSGRGPMVDVSMSAFVGWDQPQNVTPTPSDSTSDRTTVSGPFGGGSAELTYNHPGEHLSFGGSGSAFTGYFANNDEHPWYDSYAGSFGLHWTADLTRRTKLHLDEQLNASTDFRAGYFLGVGGPGGTIGNANSTFDNALTRKPVMGSQSLVDLSHDFSSKSSWSVFYGYRLSHFFSSEDDLNDFATHTVGTRYRHRMTKSLGYHIGYAYSYSNVFAEGRRSFPYHQLDVGLDYGRAMSLTRTTEFAFSTGTAILAGNQFGTDQAPFNRQRFFVLGNALLKQELGRSWTALAHYGRQLSYEDGFTQPGLYDVASGSIVGLLSRRVDVSADATYRSGRIGLRTRNFTSWTAVAQVRSAITRNLAAYAYYYYFLSDFGSDVFLPAGIPRRVDRNGVRAGVTAWLPLWYGRGAP